MMEKENKISLPLELGMRVRFLRGERKISQLELANLAMLEKNYISDLERGRRNPTLLTLEKIAAAFDISLSDLFLGLGNATSSQSFFQSLEDGI